MSVIDKRKSQSFVNTSADRIEKSDELFIILTNILNTIHKTQYSERFWRIIIAPYESSIISSWSVLEQESIDLKPVNVLHVNSLELNKSTIIFSKIRYLIKVVTSFRVLNKLKKQLKNDKNIAIGLPYLKEMKPKMDAYMETFYPILRNKKVDYKKRNVSIEYSEKYSGAFIKNVIKLIPKIYVENFENLMGKIPLYAPEEKVFHVTIFHSLFMRFVIAKYIENGAKLQIYQHGGCYGEYKYHSAHHNEGKAADQFMTWGWKINDNDVPSPAYKLQGFSNNYTIKEKKEFDILIVYPIIRSRNIDHVKQESNVFFSTINRTTFPTICARPRPIAKLNRSSILDFIKKDAATIDSGFTKIIDLISTSKLVIIFTHPSTTLLECLYVDHPILAILDNDNESSEIVKPYYDYLSRIGLLHNTMHSLVSHLNNINLEVWWADLISQPEYLSFKNEFLRKV